MSFKIGDVIGYGSEDGCICYLVMAVSKLTGNPTVVKTLGFYSKGKIKSLGVSKSGDLQHTTDPNGWDLDWKVLKEMTNIEIISDKVKQMYERRKEQGYAF
jgi:hypothetical protein